MAGCDPRPRARALGSGAVALAAALAVAAAPPIGHAQPAPPAAPAPAPTTNLERAKDLYRSAEAAMKDGRFDDAARDYGASYELIQDPALFYKIGQAHQRAGKCDVALSYYARYLREGKPTEQFAALTRERIAACGGAAGPGSAASNPATSAGSAAGAPVNSGSGSSGPATSGEASGVPATNAGSGSSSAATNAGAAAPGAATSASHGLGASGAAGGAGRVSTGTVGRPAGSEAAPRGGAGRAGGAADTASAGSGGAAAVSHPGVASNADAAGGTPPPVPGSAALIPPTREKIAWLLGGGAIALATLGGVLAYAARSSENDVRDLYAGLGGQVPTYDGATRKRYADLVDQGERYQHLSWAAFGLAGAATVGAVLLFTVGHDERPARAAVTPVVGPRSAGVSVRF